MLTSCSIPQDVASDIEVLPDNQSLNGSQFKSFESVLNSEAVPACVLTDFIEILLDEFLFLDKLDVG